MARLKSDGSLDFTDDPFADPSPPLRRQSRQSQTDPFGNPLPDSSPDDPPPVVTPGTPPRVTTEPVTPPVSSTPPAPPTPPSGSRPTGGSLLDPTYAAQYVAWAGTQPGVNPSVKNDPNYWIGRFTSGAFGNDQDYALSRMMQAEGAPEGSSGTPANAPGDNSALSDFLNKLLAQQQGYNSTITGQRQSLLDRIRGLADQYSRPVTADDPNIKAQTDAFHGTSARSLNDFREMAAERANAEGVPTGAFDSQLGNATNTAGQAEAGFQANLMQTQMMANRQALSDMLNQGAGVLSAQDSADIQNKIAAINASLGSKSLDQNFSLGSQSLSLQRLLGLMGLGNQSTAINNQNNQFYDKFAFDQANAGQTQDDLLLQWLLQNG